MNEKHLLITSIIITIIGLIILFFISKSIQINDTTINKIYSGEIKKDVKITGTVKSIDNKNSLSIITLNQIFEIKAIVFESNLTINQNNMIELYGNYDDDTFIVEKIVLLS